MACETASAGAWNQRAGEGQVISTSSWMQGGRIFNDDFEAIPLRGFTKTETRLYLEQGVTNNLTFVGNAALQTLNFRDEVSRFDLDGIDDVELGLQLKTYAREGLATSLRLSYIIDSKLDNRAVDVLGGGDQVEIRGLIGQSSETLIGDVFYDAQLAFRTERFDKLDSMQGGLTLGYKPTDRWLVLLQSNVNFADNEVVDGFNVPEQFDAKFSFSMARQYKPGRFIQLGTGRTIFGRNIVQERSVFLGVWTQY